MANGFGACICRRLLLGSSQGFQVSPTPAGRENRRGAGRRTATCVPPKEKASPSKVGKHIHLPAYHSKKPLPKRTSPDREGGTVPGVSRRVAGGGGAEKKNTYLPTNSKEPLSKAMLMTVLS